MTAAARCSGDCWQAFEGIALTGLANCTCERNHAEESNSDCHFIRLVTVYNKCIGWLVVCVQHRHDAQPDFSRDLEPTGRHRFGANADGGERRHNAAVAILDGRNRRLLISDGEPRGCGRHFACNRRRRAIRSSKARAR